jgi:hypothetical protein
MLSERVKKSGEVEGMEFDARKAIEEAYSLQLALKRKRAELKRLETEYKNALDSLAVRNVGRVGNLERVQRISKRRTINSGIFLQHFPQYFERLAHFTLKEVLAELEEGQLQEAGALEVHELVSWEIISRPEV